jgi:betaine-aldehyde dehydrogenase
VRLANDSPYGLAHAVLSADGARCERVASQLDAGMVWVNCSQPLWETTPFGGWKQSGFGKEMGEAGLLEYVKWKTRIDAPHGFNYDYYKASQ